MGSLESFVPNKGFRILYAARHVFENAAEAPATSGQYPRYHQEIAALLRDFCSELNVVDSPDDLIATISRVDYVFSLLNRVPMTNGEIFVSTLCEYHGIPYLGARPGIRAVAEDKSMAKHFVTSLGIPTAPWLVANTGLPLVKPAPFSGPYFVKPNFGAGSEWISPVSYCENWEEAVEQARSLNEAGIESLIERYLPGINITVPVIGAEEPIPLPPVVLATSAPHQILTHEDKLQSNGDMPFHLLQSGPHADSLQKAAVSIFESIRPIDYARFDFRFEPKTGRFGFLEMNICCDISSFGSLMFAANAKNMDQKRLLSHILSYSCRRQKRCRQ